MNFSDSRTPKNNITKEKLECFIEEIKGIIQGMYDINQPFVEPADLPY